MTVPDARTTLAGHLRRLAQAPDDAATAYAAATLALDHGLEEEAAAPISITVSRTADEPRLWQLLGLIERGLERSDRAIHAFTRAAALAPADPRIAHGLALVTWEAGLPAVALYEQARRLAPHEDGPVLGHAAALMAEARSDDALATLADRLAERPDWLAGHDGFAKLAAMAGRPEEATATVDRAIRSHPADLGLQLVRLAILGRIVTPAERLAATDRARRWFGDHPALITQHAIAASEAGDIAAADQLFRAIGPHADPGLALALLRHLVRAQRFGEVEALAARMVAGPETVTAWAYRQLAWRALEDPRLDWLDRGDSLVRTIDLRDDLPPLDQIAAAVRRIHVVSGQPLDQSVRGGTQSDGPLFARLEPEIQAIRAAVCRAIRRYLDELPPFDAAHPLLRQPRRASPRFAGSWSVRLSGPRGHHVSHVHAMGWISSALHLSLPEGADQSEGHLLIGGSPDDLRLDLPPIRSIAPRAGTLVLFPSHMWHGVSPISSGERLSIAFDLSRPAN